MKPPTLKRIWKEVKEVNTDFFNLRTVISPDAIGDDASKFYFVMLPNDGAMAHLTLVGTVGITEAYPEEPPVVKLYTPTRRYNVDVYREVLDRDVQRSSMCFDILRSQADGGSWKAEYTLSCLFASLMSAIVSLNVTQSCGTIIPEYVTMKKLASVKLSASKVLAQHARHLPSIPPIPVVKATPVPAVPLFAPQTFDAGVPGVLTSSPFFLQDNSDVVRTFAVDLSALDLDIVFSVILSNSKTDFVGRKADTILVRNGVTATAARKVVGKKTQWFYHGKPMNDGDMRLHVSVGRDQMTFAYQEDGKMIVHGDCPVSRLGKGDIGDVEGVPFFVHVVTKDKSVRKPGVEELPVEIRVLDVEGTGFLHEVLEEGEGSKFGFEIVRGEEAVVEHEEAVRDDGLIGGFEGLQVK